MAWGLALSGGGLLGAAHLGVLRALDDWGLHPDMLAGASAGGVVAGVLAGGGTLQALTAYGREVAARPHDYFRARGLRLAAELLPHDPVGPADSLFDPARFVDGLAALCPPPRRVEALRLPAALTSVDLAAMRPVAFVGGGRIPRPPRPTWRLICSGALRTALQATMAMPGVFEPVRGDGAFLVDGGVADNLPMDWAAALGAPRVLAVDVVAPQASLPRRAGIVWSLERTVSYFTYTMSELRAPGVPLFRLAPELGGDTALTAADFDRLVQAGYAAAAARRAAIEAFCAGRGDAG